MSPRAPSPTRPPLERLNAAEREALALLAEGHTAKSIATATGRSVHAVNERLRDARRKTGIGSSRELARLLKTPENRDELIEVSRLDHPGDAAISGMHVARRFSKKEWWIVAIVMIGGALAALMMVQASTPAVGDPRLTRMFPQGAEKGPRELHRQLLTEARDEPWAPTTERILHARFDAVRGVEKLHVTCGRVTCEVVGEIATPERRINATMQQLQGGALFRDLTSAGLKNESAMFGPDRLFVSYWTRAA